MLSLVVKLFPTNFRDIRRRVTKQSKIPFQYSSDREPILVTFNNHISIFWSQLEFDYSDLIATQGPSIYY